MLLGKYFCRCHHARLEAVVHRNQGYHQGHHGFSTADITLQKPVHLLSCEGILPNFLDHPFLCSCQFEGKVVIEKIIETRSYLLENLTFEFVLAFVFQMKEFQLNVEKFFKFKPVFCLAQGRRIQGEMNVEKSRFDGHQVELTDQPCR